MKLCLRVIALAILISTMVLVAFSSTMVAGPLAQQPETSSPMLTLTANATVYTWPSPQMDVLGEMPARSSIPANGRTPDSQWWRIPYPGGPQGNGWVTSNVVQPNQAAANVPVIEVIFATPTPAPIPPTPTPMPCTYNAAYVADVTIPDHTQIQAAQQFNKVWRMSNTGSCTWEQGTTLVFGSGFKMSAPDAVPVPVTAPGGTADIGVTMFAPSEPGSYSGVWQLRNPLGQIFGSRITVVVDVPGASPPPTPPPPQPQPSQPYINFWADTDRVKSGKCTNIHWDVRNVQSVYLEYGGHTDGVAGQGERWVCPSSDGKRYYLHVNLVDGSRQDREIKIDISGGGPTPTPTPKPKPKPSDRSISIWVDPETIKKGQCTTIHWEVGSAAHKVFINGERVEHLSGSKKWCPTKSSSADNSVCFDANCEDSKHKGVSVKVK